jgi:hypothetical protein
MRDRYFPRLTIRRAALRCLATGVLTLCGCVSYSGSALRPGQSTLDEVRATMGEPAARWSNPDGSLQLSYPRGPSGFHSYMVYLDAAGRLQRIQNVMDYDSFYRISRGMSESDVVRILGPSVPEWTNYFEARKELVWEWRYCNEFSEAARFDVLFDGDSRTVRTSMSHAEECIQRSPCFCGR